MNPVTRVHANSPATTAGIHTDDEILAVNGFRVSNDGIDERLKQFEIGATLDLLIARRGKIVTKQIELREMSRQDWSLRLIAEPSESQRESVNDWLGDAPQQTIPATE